MSNNSTGTLGKFRCVFGLPTHVSVGWTAGFGDRSESWDSNHVVETVVNLKRNQSAVSLSTSEHFRTLPSTSRLPADSSAVKLVWRPALVELHHPVTGRGELRTAEFFDVLYPPQQLPAGARSWAWQTHRIHRDTSTELPPIAKHLQTPSVQRW